MGYCVCFDYSQTPLRGHPLNMDTLLLRTVCFVPGERQPLRFSKFNPLNTDSPLIPIRSISMAIFIFYGCINRIWMYFSPKKYLSSTLHSGKKMGMYAVSSGQSTGFFSPLSSCFKMASDREKSSNYVHSHISGTQSVNTTPFCAGTQCGQPFFKGAFDRNLAHYYLLLNILETEISLP